MEGEWARMITRFKVILVPRKRLPVNARNTSEIHLALPAKRTFASASAESVGRVGNPLREGLDVIGQ
jgi:hypothetical protein